MTTPKDELKPNYSVDERVGCVAVIDNRLKSPDTNGLHPDLNFVVAFWRGKRTDNHEGGGFISWEVEDWQVQKAKKLCEELNTLPRLTAEQQKWLGMCFIEEHDKYYYTWTHGIAMGEEYWSNVTGWTIATEKMSSALTPIRRPVSSESSERHVYGKSSICGKCMAAGCEGQCQPKQPATIEPIERFTLGNAHEDGIRIVEGIQKNRDKINEIVNEMRRSK